MLVRKRKIRDREEAFMNFPKLGVIIGKIMILEGMLMLVPLLVSFVYQESLMHHLAFLIPALILILAGSGLKQLKPQRGSLYQREGFALVAIVWIVMTLFGAMPFVINGEIPGYIDACFEIMSGLTTTGASIVTDITKLSHSTLFWRSFSHWIGGMGIIVFILIFIPESSEGYSMHLLRAESPGPQVSKLVTRMRAGAKILYLIYLGLTVLEIILLMLDKPIPGYENEQFFFSVLATFGCAGTGGFGFIPGSMEQFHPFSQYVMSIFLLLFGCNFTLYYLFLFGKIKDVLRSEELKVYLGIVAAAVGILVLSLTGGLGTVMQVYTTEEAFRHSLFQTASILTTAGYTTTDYNVWPMIGKMVLLALMFSGAMAGSTSGGIKLSRVVMAVKGALSNVRKLINPRCIKKIKFEGKTVEEKTINDVFAFITIYFFILIVVTILLAFDPVNGQTVEILSDAGAYQVKHDFFSNFSAALACISNVGPAFEAVGPYASYAAYSTFSKIILTATMLLGRLEILPVLILFHPRTWKRM